MTSRAAKPIRFRPARARIAAIEVYFAVMLAAVVGLAPGVGEGAGRSPEQPGRAAGPRPDFLSVSRKGASWSYGSNIHAKVSKYGRAATDEAAGENQKSGRSSLPLAARTQTSNSKQPGDRRASVSQASHVERSVLGSDPPLPYGVATNSFRGLDGEQQGCGTCNSRRSPPPRRGLSARVEYLLWWSDDYNAPPLVTTNSVETPPEDAGILGDPSTRILFGGGGIDSDAQSGGRVTISQGCDNRQLAIEATYLGIGRDTNRFAATSNELPILARPYFDVTNGSEDALLVAHPDFLVGSIETTSSTEFQSFELLLRRTLMRRCQSSIDFVIGWRWAMLEESLRVANSSEWTEAQGLIAVGTTQDMFDLFDTKSQFNGAELGVLVHDRYGSWSLDLLMKLGLGNSRSEVRIDGQTVTRVPDAGSSTFAGGLLAQETNIGRYSRDDFALIPELGLTLGYNITCDVRLAVGYTFIYWSQVARPGAQIDRDVSQLPPETPTGARRPRFSFRTSDYWMQGMNSGIEYRF